MRRSTPSVPSCKDALRVLARSLALVGMFSFFPATQAKTSLALAETPEQAERRMTLIEAASPPPPPSPADEVAKRLKNLERLNAGLIGIRADVLDADGRPLNRDEDKTGNENPNRFVAHIQSSDTSFRFLRWEKEHAPAFREIVLPAADLAQATAAEGEARTVTIPPIQLERGVPGAIRLLAPDGRPVPDAVASFRARPREGVGADLSWDEALWSPGFAESDAEGRVPIRNVSESFAVQARVWAPGFLPEHRVFDNLADGVTPVWSLTPVPLVNGLAIDARTREPIAGARVEFSDIAAPDDDRRSIWRESLVNARETITDANGFFSLPRLPFGWRGGATLKREGYADLPLGDLAQPNDLPPEAIREHAMQRGHRLAGRLRVPPGFLRDTHHLPIEAFVDPDPAPGAYHKATARIAFQNRTQMPTHVVWRDGNFFDLEATEIPFEFPNLPEGRILLKAFFSAHQLFVETTVDLTSDRDDAELVATRADGVEISLVSSDRRPVKARGRLGYYLTDGSSRGPFAFGLSPGDRHLPITEGRAFGGLVGASRGLKVVFVDNYIVGYRFKRESRHGGATSTQIFDLPPDGAPLRKEIVVEPAGAFRVRLPEDDPSTGIRQKSEARYNFLGPDYSTGGSRIPDDGFWRSPLPLSGECELVVRRGSRIASTGRVALTLENPVFDRVLPFPEGTRVTGRLLDATGRPVGGGKVRAGYQYIEPQPSMLMEAAECITRPDGGFTLENVNFDLPHSWWLETVPEPEGPPTMPRHRLRLDAAPDGAVELRLPEVHEVRGRLLDHETGQPVAGVKVSAFVWIGSVTPPRDGRPPWTSNRQPAVAETDSDGVFHFRNLPAGPYALSLWPSYAQIVEIRDQVQEPQAAADPRKWIHLLQVPEPADEPNVFWRRGDAN